MTDPHNTHTYLIKTGLRKHTLAAGVGFNILLSNQSALPALRETRKWRQVMAALDDLRPAWMRVGVIPTAERGAWDDRRTRWDFDHPHFRAMTKIGRWAAANDCTLMFDP